MLPPLKPHPLQTTSWLVILLAGVAALHLHVVPGDATGLLYDLRNEGLNRIDQGRMVRGYYQNLNDAAEETRGGLPERLADWLVIGDKGPRWAARLVRTGASRDTKEGYLLSELVPGIETEHIGVPFSVNRWGQRDRDYEPEKPDGVFRIAYIGASNTMGWGVLVEECYAELLEARLNRELVGKTSYQRYEVINFASPGYSATEFLYVAEAKAAPFRPDLILIENCAEEIRFNIAENVANRLAKGRDLRYPYIKELIQRSGVSPGDALFRLKRRINPIREGLLLAAYRHLAEWSVSSSIPVAVTVLRLEVAPRIDPLLEWSASEAEKLGLIAIRVFEAMAGQDRRSVYLAHEKDQHPSAKGHALLADELYERLLSHARTRALLLGTGQGPHKDH